MEKKGKRQRSRNRLLAAFLSMTVVATSVELPASTVSAAENASASEVFVIKNGDFSNGLDHWEQFTAPVSWGAYDINAVWANEAGSVSLDIAEGGTGNFNQWDDSNTQTTTYPSWLLALNQKDITMYPDIQYTLSATIDSTIDRMVKIGIEQPDGAWTLWSKDVELQAGENQIVIEDIPQVETEFAGNFYIQMGYNDMDFDYDYAYPAHKLTVSDVRLEQAGAREKYLLIMDSDFTNTGAYTTTANVTAADGYLTANVTDLGAAADSTAVTYTDIALEEGMEYKLQFSARADNARKIQCKVGDTVVAGDVALENATNTYSYTFTAAKTERTSLTFLLGNVTGAEVGNVYLDNIGLWSGDTDTALGITFTDSDIKLPSAELTPVNDKVAEGTDVVFDVTAADLNAWKNGSKSLYINKKTVSASYVTISGDQVVVAADAFDGTGSYKVAIRSNGFEKTNQASVTILPGNGNILTNGSFEEGLSGWTNYALSGCSDGTVGADHTLDVHIKWWNPWSYDNNPPYQFVDWQSMLTQNVEVERGKTYVVSFIASASVERPIGVVLKDIFTTQYVDLTTEMQEYNVEITATKTGTVELQLLLGYMKHGSLSTPGSAWSENMEDETIDHHVYIRDVIMTDKSNVTNDKVVRYPSIGGVNSGGVYRDSVIPDVIFGSEYTLKLYKENETGTFVQMSYTEGTPISTVGTYKIEAISAADTSIKTTKTFSIVASEIDYSKTYYIIKSRSNSKTIMINGVVDGAAVVQQSYDESIDQFFSKEKTSGNYFVLRSASCNKVISVANNSSDNAAKLVITEYDAADKYQQWYLKYQSQGYYSICNRQTGKAIDIPSAAGNNGVQLQQYDANGSNAQQWDIVEMDLKSILEPEADPDTNTQAAWKKNAIKAPTEGDLVPAGPIYVKWYNNPQMGEVKEYEITFDGEVQPDKVTATNDSIMQYAVYTTDMTIEHNVVVTAILDDGSKVVSDTRNFWVSKKGVGWATLYRTQDMNISWYYNWATTKSAGTDETLDFTPMVWGDWGVVSESLAEIPSDATAILGYNEPDGADQSNVPIQTAIDNWHLFTETGLRTGSPVTAIPAIASDGEWLVTNQNFTYRWFPDYYEGIQAKGEDFDFMCVHSYQSNCSAEDFLNMVDETYAEYGKPIWITEFGVADWGTTPGMDSSKKDQVYEFMKKVLPELDKRDYVERYAWFPFDPNDTYGGGSGIFNYDTGELNELGKLYAASGLPEGYEGVDYGVVVERDDSIAVKSITSTIDSTYLAPGATKQIQTEFVPANATNKKLRYTSSSDEVATVDANGVITGVSEGAAIITVTSKSNATITSQITVNVRKINITGVTVTAERNQMVVNTTQKVTAAVVPADKENQQVTYTSSNPVVATVDANGTVTAKSVGTANIIATAINGINGQVTIEVIAAPTAANTVTIKLTNKKILVKQSVTAVAAVVPAGKSITWTSSNEAAARVSAKGVIKGIAPGKATITADTGNGKASIVVTVVKPTVKWNVSYKTVPLQLKKTTTALKAIGVKSGDKIVSYTSSNKKVATVSKKGKIRAKKVGTTKITVKTKYGAKATIKIKVQKAAVKVTSITVNKKKVTLKKGKTFQLVTTKKYITSRYKVTYTSSNKKVATVSAKGKIKAKKKGKATITVKCNGKKKTVKVVVK